MEATTPIFGAFESRPASFSSRVIRRLSELLTGEGGELIPEDSAPEWSLRDAVYNRVQGSKQLLGKTVALVFCGTWCVPCAWEVPAWKELHRTYAMKGLRIVGVFMDYPDDIRRFAMEQGITNWYHACPASQKILWDFGVYPAGRVPYLAIVNRHGILCGTWVGYHAREDYERAVLEALKH